MTSASPPVDRDLVLVGGGHAHVGVLKWLGMHPVAGLRVTLVSPSGVTPYTGMIPGLVAGHYRFDEAHLELPALCRFAGAQFYRASVIGLDCQRRRVQLAGRAPVAFHLLSINTGSIPRRHDVPGAAEHALAVKPVEAFLRGWETILDRVRSRPTDPLRVVGVGGGAGGVELLLAVRHRLRRECAAAGGNPDRLQFELISASAAVPAGHAHSVQRQIASALAAQGVTVRTGCRVVAVDPDSLLCDDGSRVAFEVLLWTTQASAPAWLAQSGLATTADGFLQVNGCLQSTSHPWVFGAGDVADVLPHPRPKSGVFAVRQGRPMAENLLRALSGIPLRPFRPQRRFLGLISLGDRDAVASWGPLAVGGRWVWRLKDRIDRRWMRSYQELPPMRPRPASEGKPAAHREPMRCGGCGAKVGADILGRVLKRLPPGPRRTDVLVGLAEPDDAAVVSVPAGRVAVHTVDFLRAFLDDPFLFGRLAANHALGDLYAMGAEPQSALAIVTLPFGGEASVEERLYQLLAGATETLTAHGVALVGGHTAEGAELAAGFSVQGIAVPDRLWRKRGLRTGDALVLTKPLGTGVVLAAAMRGRARARWLEAAIESMGRSAAPAAACLARHPVSACTDVTGFGLAGHLLEMLGPEGPGATLSMAAVPWLDGAIELAAAGVRSSLYPQNRRSGRALEADGSADGPPGIRDLLFDPQTAGGLLAGIPWTEAAACVDQLRAAGYPAAAVIGRVGEPTGAEVPRLRMA